MSTITVPYQMAFGTYEKYPRGWWRNLPSLAVKIDDRGKAILVRIRSGETPETISKSLAQQGYRLSPMAIEDLVEIAKKKGLYPS